VEAADCRPSKVTNLEVLRVLLSIVSTPGRTKQATLFPSPIPTSVSAVPPAPTVSFADLTQTQGETNPESLNGGTLQANLIIPEPCHFLNPALGPVALIRPTSTRLNGAVAAIQGFVDDGLFIGQKDPAFLNTVFRLAEEADDARRAL